MERIGKYVIHQAVMTTGPARIFLCHDPDLQIPAAVKLFAPLPSGSSPFSPAQQLNRFLAEARLLATFDNPYIIGIRGLEQLGDGRPYFVMPFMTAHLPHEIGKDFRNAGEEAAAQDRDKPRRMAPPRAMAVLRQMAAGLLALHRRNMVHRHIKPSNILLTSTQNGSIKLCDFTMVKLPERNLPLPDHWIGGLDYVAPEQRGAASTVTARADIYSLGILAYRVLTGRLPRSEDGSAELPADFPSQMVDLVQASTDPDPARRPAHAGEFLARLEQVPQPRQAPARPVVEMVPPRKVPPPSAVNG